MELRFGPAAAHLIEAQAARAGMTIQEWIELLAVEHQQQHGTPEPAADWTLDEFVIDQLGKASRAGVTTSRLHDHASRLFPASVYGSDQLSATLDSLEDRARIVSNRTSTETSETRYFLPHHAPAGPTVPDLD